MATKRKAAADDAPDAKKPRAITSFFSSNGTTSSSTKGGPKSNFNKDDWVKSLTPAQRELLRLEIDTLDESWLGELTNVLTSNSFLELKAFLKEEKKNKQVVYPPEEDIYSWSRLTPLNTVKVVILGQDPYHGPNQAHGLCFSVRPPTPAPPSLKNMYIALQNDYSDFKPPPNNGGLLTPWAKQGVLMLNACLTVRKGDANSHSRRGWEALTQKAIEVVAKNRPKGVVFLAWGKPAADRVRGIDKKKHCVLYSVHPSPLSANRGFFDCGHFKKSNEWLATKYGVEGIINWNLGGGPAALPKTSKTKANDMVVGEGKEGQIKGAEMEEEAEKNEKGDKNGKEV